MPPSQVRMCDATQTSFLEAFVGINSLIAWERCRPKQKTSSVPCPEMLSFESESRPLLRVGINRAARDVAIGPTGRRLSQATMSLIERSLSQDIVF